MQNAGCGVRLRPSQQTQRNGSNFAHRADRLGDFESLKRKKFGDDFAGELKNFRRDTSGGSFEIPIRDQSVQR
jgi:hypothetical protein